MELTSLAELNGVHGFVVAPFEVKGGQPVLVIQGQTERLSLKGGGSGDGSLTPSASLDWVREPSPDPLDPPISPYYKVDFANYHSQLANHQFRKIVLARCADETMKQTVSPMTLFYRACEMYPRLFIALVETEKSGCWLTATPEILLEGEGQDWRTIALAGTMRLEGERLSFDSPPSQGETRVDDISWSTKNIQEQRIVATYITECLEQFTGDFREEGPRTVRAANLVHLRSDFTFKLTEQGHIGELLQTLHPTPAVCGLPKREAFQFITKNEHTPRRYYSGFMGPLQMEGTHLYVSLRCMNIEGEVCHLFAGGGLLKDSTEEQEWAETEAKMETMRRILQMQEHQTD